MKLCLQIGATKFRNGQCAESAMGSSVAEGSIANFQEEKVIAIVITVLVVINALNS